MHFIVNHDLLRKARAVLAQRRRIYWLLGAAGSGKSTIAQAIAATHSIAVCDMDSLIYGQYQSRYDDARHPAARAWFGAENPLAWVLSLSTAQFDGLLAALDAEILDLYADDLADLPIDQPLLVDGGLAHPAILAQVMPVERIICLEISVAMSDAVWESAERNEMKTMIDELPGAPEPWRKFLASNAMITRNMSSESRDNGIRLLPRRDGVTVETLAATVAGEFGL